MFELKPEYQKVFEVSTFAAVVAVFITIAKTVISSKHGGWLNFCVELSASLLVAILIGLAIEETSFSFVTKAAVIGFCAFIASDILEVVKKFREAFVADPKGFIKEMLDMWKGR